MNRPLNPSLTNPPVALIIIGLCVIIFLLQGGLPASLALWPLESGRFQPWQLISYGFLHGSFNHIFFNLFAVWMFGLQIERVWGSQRFLLYYVVCLLGAALTQLLVQQLNGGMYPTIGASGAVFGLLLAFGVMFPNNRIFLIFLPVLGLAPQHDLEALALQKPQASWRRASASGIHCSNCRTRVLELGWVDCHWGGAAPP